MIEHLVVVAGPSGCGKSTLIKKLLTNKLPEINTRLVIDDFTDWDYIIDRNIPNLAEPYPRKAVLEYNSLRCYLRKFANKQDEKKTFLAKCK